MPETFNKGQVDFNEFTIKGDIQTGELFNKNPASIKANINLSKNKDDYGTLRVEGTMEDKRFVGDLTSDALKLPFSLDLVNKKIDLQKGLTLKAHLDAQPEDIKISELKAFLEDIKLEGELAYKISNITGQLLLSEGPAQIKLLVQGLSDDKNLWNGHITIHSDKPQAFLKWVGADDKGPYLQGEIDIGTSLSVQDSSYVFKGLKFKVVDQAQLAKILLQEFANRAIDNAVQGIGGKVGDLLKGVLGKKQETPALKPDSSEQPLQPVQQQAPQENSIKPEKIIKDLLKAF
eukprot:gene16049-16218_t